jgi:hypothetical protein
VVLEEGGVATIGRLWEKPETASGATANMPFSLTAADDWCAYVTNCSAATTNSQQQQALLMTGRD